MILFRDCLISGGALATLRALALHVLDRVLLPVALASLATLAIPQLACPTALTPLSARLAQLVQRGDARGC